MKNKIWILMVMAILMLSACSNPKPEMKPKNKTEQTQEQKTTVEGNAEKKEVPKEQTQTATDSQNEKRKIIDTAGREVEIPKQVKSIICVGVGTLRFTSYMQATDLVVGVEENEMNPKVTKPFSYVNQEIFAKLPHTGNNGKTYDEEIIKVNPDVIMTSGNKEAADLLQQKTGIPVVAVPLIDNMFDEKIFQMFALLGEVYGRPERAEELIAYVKELRADLESRTADIKEADKPKVYVGGVSFKGHHGFEGTEADYSPFTAINAFNLADQTGQKGAFNIDLEQVLEWDPDIIFLDFNGMSLIKEDYAKNADYYNSLKAIGQGRVYSQISFRFNAVNAELSMADAYYAGKIIYPDRFADIDPVQKAEEIFEKMLGVKFYDTLKENGYEFREIKITE
ncbi:iron ABC transporter substrate-binding protein [Clostridiales bacterium COT073_COT-073]|nr:iron ABC transporter substrate-binding protein [Clostridiales bacterium COT073_COT-073]